MATEAPFSEPTTSLAAAVSVGGFAAAMRERALARILTAPDGLTCDELEVATGWKHQTASARLWELEGDGRIYKSAQRRVTRSGRNARVYYAE